MPQSEDAEVPLVHPAGTGQAEIRLQRRLTQEPGLDGFVAALKAFHGAFPDLRANVTHAVADGDLVVGRLEITGTQRGTFLGMPGSGRKVRYEEMAMVRMDDGKIAEHWSVADALAILQQLQTSEIV